MNWLFTLFSAILSSFTSTLFEMKKKIHQLKCQQPQYTLNQGWKCSKYATAKPKSSECHIHKVTPLSKPTAWSKAFPVTHFSFSPSFLNQEEEMRGSEKQRDYTWARNHLKEFNSLWPILISYWSNQRQTHILVFPSMPVTWAMLVTTAQCWNHQEAKVAIQQASGQAWSETLGIASCPSWTAG